MLNLSNNISSALYFICKRLNGDHIKTQCGESVGIFGVVCGESVGRVRVICGESVGKVRGECW